MSDPDRLPPNVYRTAAAIAKATPTKRCCGHCDAIIGGCVYGVRWPTKRTIDNPFARPLDADRSARCPNGTPPAVMIDGVWRRETR